MSCDELDETSESSNVANSQSGSETNLEEEYDLPVNSQTHSDTELEEYYFPAKRTDDISGDMGSAISRLRSRTHKRKQKHVNLMTDKRQRRVGKARNVTHASKIECMDVTEIQDFVRHPPPCCDNKCLKHLRLFANRAVSLVSELRHARFAGKFVPSKHRSNMIKYPGVKIIN